MLSVVCRVTVVSCRVRDHRPLFSSNGVITHTIHYVTAHATAHVDHTLSGDPPSGMVAEEGHDPPRVQGPAPADEQDPAAAEAQVQLDRALSLIEQAAVW